MLALVCDESSHDGTAAKPLGHTSIKQAEQALARVMRSELKMPDELRGGNLLVARSDQPDCNQPLVKRKV